jgi:hypothetical protein
MQSFRDFLLEAGERFQMAVHHDPSPAQLKALAKGSDYNYVRYVVKDNHLVAGDAAYHIHQDLHPEANGNPSSRIITGMIRHYPETGETHFKGHEMIPVKNKHGEDVYELKDHNDEITKHWEKHGLHQSPSHHAILSGYYPG